MLPTVSSTSRATEDRSDGEGLLAGPFIDWQLSEFTDLYLEGGYQSLRYNHASNFNNADIAALGLSAAEAASVQQILAGQYRLEQLLYQI